MINPFKELAVCFGLTCHKHRLILFRELRWYEDEYRKGYRNRLICRRCHKIFDTKIKFKVTDKFGLPL